MTFGIRLLFTLVAVAGLAVTASANDAEQKRLEANQDTPVVEGVALDCSGASPITCGESQTNSAGPGLGNVDIYGCSGLSYDNAEEFVYELCVGGDGEVTIDMTYTHDSTANDLDMLLLGSCDESDCIDDATGTSGTEQIVANLTAGTYYVVIDGWGGRQDGSPHSFSVTCDEPCMSTPVEAATWSEIKSTYSE